MQIVAESNVIIRNSFFTNGQALIGGAIYLLGDSNLHVENTKFLDNEADLMGGAIAAESFNEINIYGGTIFHMNLARNLTGDAIYAASSLRSLKVKDSKFTATLRNGTSNFIDVSQVNLFTLDNTVIEEQQDY